MTRRSRTIKLDLVKLIGGIVALVFLIRGDVLAAAWALWVVAMFSVELGQMYARITVDYLHQDDPGMFPENHAGKTWGEKTNGGLLTFRLLDDDGEVYYRGVGDDESFEVVYSWAMGDAGATLLQVRKDGEWRDEIA